MESAAQVVASIEDLLSKILCLLSIKDLLRFKSVSKHWRTLISDPNFCRLRSSNPKPVAAGIILPSARGHELNEYVPFSALNSRRFQLNFSHCRSQSCNGLLLFKYGYRYSVYNPTTNCCLELPETLGGWGIPKFMTLAFDPLKSRHYNVVCILLLLGADNQLMIQMYTSETRSWGVCGGPLPATIDFVNGVYWNGAIHWLGLGHEGGMYFKVEHQVIEKMPLMPFRHERSPHGCKRYFGHSCDHLHLIEKPRFGNPFDVYEMKRDYSEWFVKYRVDLCPAEGVADFRFNFSVLNVIRGEAEEDAFLVMMTYDKIIRYNLVSDKFDKLCECGDRRIRIGLEDKGLEYIESLCCI